MTDRLPVEEFRAVLMGEHPRLHKFRRRLRHPNTTARLAAAAMAGEVLVSRAAAEAAEVDLAGLPARTLEVRGRRETIEVLSLRVGTPTAG